MHLLLTHGSLTALCAPLCRADHSAKGLQGVNIEVETRTLQEVEEVVGLLKATRGSDTGSRLTRIMLDNMVVTDASKAEQGGVDVGLLQEVRRRFYQMCRKLLTCPLPHSPSSFLTFYSVHTCVHLKSCCFREGLCILHHTLSIEHLHG